MSQENSPKIESTSESSMAEEDMPWKSPRLPKNVRPVKYNLLIYPKIDVGLFHGDIMIDINVSSPTRFILVHQTNLNIEHTKLTSKNETSTGSPIIEKTWAFENNHYWIIETTEKLQPGDYELYMSFKGTLGNGTIGLYKTTYTNPLKEQCSTVLSYFEPTYARCAFPCFDEPSFRAIFYIKIAHDARGRLVALSNSCREKETLDFPSPGVNTVHFKPTPPMPPYLVAIIVGDFLYTKPIQTSKDNISVAVYSRPELVPYMLKAQKFASFVVDFFSTYFDIPYELNKLDLIALPDSNIGGMENWGMITFREDCLLLNDESTCDDLLRVVRIIGHEISHMWFGDLVTISWWDNLWLKEGFATYMSYLPAYAFYPEWYNEWVLLRETYRALSLDSALSSHPLVQTVNTTGEIREVFDAISYDKGCCLIRMLQDLDVEGFQKGIRSYLKRYKFESTITQNLWDELEAKVDFDVTNFMDTWTKQMGYPVLHVEGCYGRNIVISQERFLLSKHSTYDKTESPYKYKWDVPIKYISSDDLRNVKLAWLKKEQDTVALDCSNTVGWVKLNWHQVGFYRVNYPPDQWEMFSIQLIRNPLVLDVEDRVNLIDDAFSLASAGYFYYNIPLNILRYLKAGKEKHFFPWSVTAAYLDVIGSRLVGTEAHSLFLKFIHLLLNGNLSEKIWEFGPSVPYLTTKLNLELIKLACWSEEPKSLEKVKNIFDDWLTNGNLPHHELRPIVYSYGLASDITEEKWEKVLDYTQQTVDVKEKSNLWLALGNIRNKDYLIRLIELAKDENQLKSQDFFFVLNSIIKHSIGLEVVWDFLRNEWEYLEKRFTLENLDLCRTVYNICSQFGTEEKLKETTEFFNKYPNAGSGVRWRQIALERIQLNIKWSSTNYALIKEWLENFDPNGPLNPALEEHIVV